jgi:hypothetical protein
MEHTAPASEVPQAPAPEQDLSKRTLVILVLLSCLISLVGTLALFYELSHAGAAPNIPVVDGSSNAQAGFAIGAKEVQQPKTTGFATLTIGDTYGTLE